MIILCNTPIHSLPSDWRRAHSPHPSSTPQHGTAPQQGGPTARQGGTALGGESIKTTRGPRPGRGQMGGRGLAARAPEAVSGSPKEDGGLFTFRPSSANGRMSARVPSRLFGQLRWCPRWRRWGVVLADRCSRAQRRRGGRVLPDR